ncbi:hypothetical protein GLOIN_2v1780731 [Rhizophagus irregularis DAOM 181602=DAOM 197198]|uniref:F-box domain-containing protein n=1 Tax=Rhizophagus irregularis (strain DAOM 181602 / DAOM 197198 / MUCL 43194) TaxID=747089 RepID=A0A2P4PLP3_RHIID|nr:hypothetical protein GLOIN_2v1780731 [Rhizophagus irregularis DAOM 181602=DAOM 197198]POG66314.1 hypothetical protein GLOIN_2v1780731 [Rhizophagus irregularis DAOM 181602=DAOM 197198]|eukprot:XP_025173180.1 hypothetical protein GLOIN_2v1780731 [Rhizophagus irregularis DAOM 181602=DAOM 197198]
MVQLVEDVLLLIFIELQNDPASLYSCILVNKTWCRIAVPILWKYFSYAYKNPYNHKRESREKLYNVIAHFLPNSSKDKLAKNDIKLPLNLISNMLLFNYMEFFTRLTSALIEDMARLLIKENSNYKINLVENEIYNLIFNRCKNIRHFNWNTQAQLYLCPNAEEFFSNIRSLEFNFLFITPVMLLKLAVICQNITDLKIHDCDEDSLDLVLFIKMQNNLRSLSLNFNNKEEQYIQLSNIIGQKAVLLKKISLGPVITLIRPTFFPSLTYLQYLFLNNNDCDLYESVNWQEWEHYINMTTFPYLQYLKTLYLLSSIECLIIERSGEKILEIDVYHPLKTQDYPTENKKLIKMISLRCPKIIKLTLDVDPDNLEEISNLLSNCSLLEKIYFTTKNYIYPNGDKLLKIMSNKSPATLREFSFVDKWNFSLKGLESFLEDWKNKNQFPIKFTHYYKEFPKSFCWVFVKKIKKKNGNFIFKKYFQNLCGKINLNVENASGVLTLLTTANEFELYSLVKNF